MSSSLNADPDLNADDPHLWLEDWDGPEVMAWVARENGRTLAGLEADPNYRPLFEDALAIASAKDRIAMPSRLYGRIYNFWRDGDRPQGIWRWTSPESYATDDPAWTIALDLDDLSTAEGAQWVWKGAIFREAEDSRCLVGLSEGGEDAVVYREFDLSLQRFVTDGFALPRSKQGAAWLDADTLLVSRDWGAGTMTASGYPFTVRLIRRGDALDDAVEIFRGAPDDQLGTYASVFRDAHGRQAVTITRQMTFFSGETFLWDAERGTVRLDIPQRAGPVVLIEGEMLFQTDEPWGEIPAGALVSVPLDELAKAPIVPTPLFVPADRQALAGAAATRDRVLVVYTDNVRGRIDVVRRVDGSWTRRPLTFQDNSRFGVAGTSQHDNKVYLTVEGFLAPATLYALDLDGEDEPRAIKATPARFDATGLVVEQHEAVSGDGVRIPYFLVRHRDAAADGTTPTLLTAYGGFQVSLLPAYSGLVGKLWLDRGGAYAVANIRGGGEFGPAWHDIGRKTNRQIVYDDFAAVARDLFSRGVTRPDRLGIYGGSNGGLLMGVQMTQHPELWGAVTIQVPLLDMLRYEQIAAGKSWVDEFGSVTVPDERAFLETISPYHALRADISYPEPLIWTTTKDDRVGPQHARKFAARLAEMDKPYLFYEAVTGGHSGDANLEQLARLQAIQATYFASKLMRAGPNS